MSMISERVMPRFSYFREILEILPKFCKILMQKLLEICPKKMDPLNPHGGNSWPAAGIVSAGEEGSSILRKAEAGLASGP